MRCSADGVGQGDRHLHRSVAFAPLQAAHQTAHASEILLRGTGARGLRAILEEVLLNVMYDVPSRDDVAQVIITSEVVKDSVLPTLVPRDKLAKRERRERSA